MSAVWITPPRPGPQFNILIGFGFWRACSYGAVPLLTVRPYQVFYSKILATLLPVIYCKNAQKLISCIF